MHSANTLDRGVSAILGQQQPSAMGDPFNEDQQSVQAALTVLSSKAISINHIYIYLTYPCFVAPKACRAQIQHLVSQLGASDGVDPGSGPSGLRMWCFLRDNTSVSATS